VNGVAAVSLAPAGKLGQRLIAPRLRFSRHCCPAFSMASTDVACAALTIKSVVLDRLR
jgi:hypothetical protein